jgi:RNA polymerase sigma factor (sigma-70 family)
MDQLLRKNWQPARHIAYAEAHKWRFPDHDFDDVFQDTLERFLRYHKPADVARDTDKYFLGGIYLNAKTVAMRRRGFHNGKARPQSAQAAGEQVTDAVGLFRPIEDGDNDLMLVDERILQTVPSAEDVYMATVPNKRQAALRAAIDGLPDLQRTVLLQQYYEELSVADSARLLGMPEAAVASARAEGMRKLRNRLNPRGKMRQNV